MLAAYCCIADLGYLLLYLCYCFQRHMRAPLEVSMHNYKRPSCRADPKREFAVACSYKVADALLTTTADSSVRLQGAEPQAPKPKKRSAARRLLCCFSPCCKPEGEAGGVAPSQVHLLE